MVILAETLAKGIPFVRIDFYEVQGQIYFGELIFYPGDGLEEFRPEEWDRILGSWISLPPGQKSKCLTFISHKLTISLILILYFGFYFCNRWSEKRNSDNLEQ